jgi:hypothetical protein
MQHMMQHMVTVAAVLMLALSHAQAAPRDFAATSTLSAHDATEFSAAKKKKRAARATTVKSSKSNTSDRVRGGDSRDKPSQY